MKVALSYYRDDLFGTNYVFRGGDEMREPHPMPQTMKISEVRGHLNTLVNRVFRKETRVVVERAASR